LEIKPKLNTPLKNVTIVVAAVDGNVIGEVQLCLEGNIEK